MEACEHIQPSSLKELVARYHVRIPRYTSYPTAVEFKKEYPVESWKEALERDLIEQGPDTSLYLHVPFCSSLCFFCACSKEITKDRRVVRPYLDALQKELKFYEPYASRMKIVQLHWGGGSPNFLSPEEMHEVYLMIRNTFPHWNENTEFSVELDPRETSTAHIDVLRSNHVTRLSFGVQDLNEEVQRVIHRRQSKEQTALLTRYARSQGIEGINYDLIYGLPAQTVERWSDTIDHVISLMPDRIALYGYAHVEWKSVAQKTFDKKSFLPNAEQRIDLFINAYEKLLQAGYYYIGFDHFARGHDALRQAYVNGTMRRNFMGYTTGGNSRVIGLGPSAISSTQNAFVQNTTSVSRYQQLLAQQEASLERGLTLSRDDQKRRWIIESIMCSGTVDKNEYRTLWRDDFDQTYDAYAARQLVDDGIISNTNDRLTVTPQGQFFLRNIASLFDAYLVAQVTPTAKVYSMTM